MDNNIKKILLFIAALCVIAFVISMIITMSKFDNIQMQLTQNYSTVGEKCQRNDRQYPEGKVPGSYLGLNRAERAELLRRFVSNNPNLIVN